MVQAHSWEKPLEYENREKASHSPILTSEEARQGIISGRVRMVLAISLMLVIASFAVIFIVNT